MLWGVANLGSPFGWKIEWDSQFGECQNTHLHQQRLSFGACPRMYFSGPWDCTAFACCSRHPGGELLLCKQDSVRGCACTLSTFSAMHTDSSSGRGRQGLPECGRAWLLSRDFDACRAERLVGLT